MLVQLDGSYSALSPAVHGDIALRINSSDSRSDTADTDLKGTEDSEKQDTIDGPDISFLKLKLISEQENGHESHLSSRLVLP